MKPKDSDSGGQQKSAFVFVRYHDEASAEHAIEVESNTEWFGRRIRVEHPDTPNERQVKKTKQQAPTPASPFAGFPYPPYPLPYGFPPMPVPTSSPGSSGSNSSPPAIPGFPFYPPPPGSSSSGSASPSSSSSGSAAPPYYPPLYPYLPTPGSDSKTPMPPTPFPFPPPALPNSQSPSDYTSSDYYYAWWYQQYAAYAQAAAAVSQGDKRKGDNFSDQEYKRHRST